MPAALKRSLAGEAARRGQSLNDLAVTLLASRFAVPFSPSGRKGSRPSEGGDVLLRMPSELKQVLGRRASERRKTTHDLMLETLADGLDPSRKESMSANGNGKPRSDAKVRVALIGVGNCANSLLQGI